jgi:zinc protease
VSFFKAIVLAAATLIAGLCPAGAATKITPVTSPGGITAWLVQEKRIPMLALEVVWRGGAALDPMGREGLAEIAAAMIEEGAGDLDSQAFQARLADNAISLGFGADRDFFRANLRALTEHRDEAFHLLGLAITKPRFDAEPLARIRQRHQAQFQRSINDPDSIANRTWFAEAFPGHPYGRRTDGSLESVAAITPADLRAFVRARLGRDNMVIGVVGDIDAAALGRLLDATFGKLPARSATAAVAEQAPATRAEPLVVRRDIPQSVVVLGGAGIKRDDPDWYAASVLNYVLGGGGFASRLNNEVREKRGLAYSVHAYLQPMEKSALHLGGVATRNDRVAESLAVVRDEWRRLRDHGVTPEELANAKSFLTGSFPLRLNSNGRIAGMLTGIQLQNLGMDYIERYASYIEAVDIAQVNRVARRMLNPDGLLVVVVGQPAGLGG